MPFVVALVGLSSRRRHACQQGSLQTRVVSEEAVLPQQGEVADALRIAEVDDLIPCFATLMVMTTLMVVFSLADVGLRRAS